MVKEKMYTLGEILENKLLLRRMLRLGDKGRQPYKSQVSIRHVLLKAGIKPSWNEAKNQMVYQISESQLKKLNEYGT